MSIRSSTVYLARNVVNAPELKARISARSRERGDSPEIAAWLHNHFYRYLVGNFNTPPEAVQAITTTEALQQRYAAGAPAWALALLARKAGPEAWPAESALWWISPGHESVLALERQLLEFLQSRQGTSLEGKLARINCPQALERWAQEHQAFEAQQLAGWRQHQPQAIQAVWQGSQGEFVELLPGSGVLREEMAYESQMMRHCLGQFANRRQLTGGYGEHYAEGCEQGRMRIFSYRTGQGQPRITINAWLQPDGRLRIDQIKGKQNRPPIDRYRADVIAFLNQLNTSEDTPDDALGMRLLRTTGTTPGWHAVETLRSEAEHLQIWQRQPRLLAHIPQASPLLQWLVAAHDSSLLAGQSLPPALAFSLEQAGKAPPKMPLGAGPGIPGMAP